MRIVNCAAALLGVMLLGGCVSEPYARAFSACDDRAGACYRRCDAYAGGRGFSSCHRDCERRANQCFNAAYAPYRSSTLAYGYGSGWRGRYGAWHPRGGYSVFVTVVDGRSYYGRRRNPYYRDPYYRGPYYGDPYYDRGRRGDRNRDRDRQPGDDRAGGGGSTADPARQRERDQNMATGVWRGPTPPQRPKRSSEPATTTKTPPPSPQRASPAPSRRTAPATTVKRPPPSASSRARGDTEYSSDQEIGN